MRIDNYYPSFIFYKLSSLFQFITIILKKTTDKNALIYYVCMLYEYYKISPRILKKIQNIKIVIILKYFLILYSYNLFILNYFIMI